MKTGNNKMKNHNHFNSRAFIARSITRIPNKNANNTTTAIETLPPKKKSPITPIRIWGPEKKKHPPSTTPSKPLPKVVPLKSPISPMVTPSTTISMVKSAKSAVELAKAQIEAMDFALKGKIITMHDYKSDIAELYGNYFHALINYATVANNYIRDLDYMPLSYTPLSHDTQEGLSYTSSEMKYKCIDDLSRYLF